MGRNCIAASGNRRTKMFELQPHKQLVVLNISMGYRATGTVTFSNATFQGSECSRGNDEPCEQEPREERGEEII